jgi:hypothetical protein
MKIWRNKQRLLGVALALALLGSLVLGVAVGVANSSVELLVNGNFEGGFKNVPGCGMVGNGWGCFTNGGTVDYGFYDDQWGLVVKDGKNSQLIELNTVKYAASEADRYAGIYQTAKLVPGAMYTFKVSGLMRERNPDPNEDKYRYRVQWGYTADGSTDWNQVTNWVELPWDKIDNRTAPTGLQDYATTFQAPSKKITLFVRVWKKWGTPYRELDVNLDAISLTGKGVVIIRPPVGKPPVGKPPVVIVPPTDGGGSVIVIPPTDSGGSVIVIPPADSGTPPPGLTCGGTNFICNGNFEGGFVNGVGSGWASFTNGGAATYGFYDEQWPPVVKDGKNGQLIEINTWGLAASNPDRVAGIYQVVGGLKPGAVYEFSMWGELREDAVHPGDDPYRYRVQWGYAPAGTDPSAIANWTEVPWNTIYGRTAPGPMASFSAKLTAPSDKIVLAIRAWKKWGTVQRELDVNLDAIALTACGSGSVIVIPPTNGNGGQCTWYVVKSGDYLSKIAAKYHVSVASIVAQNKIKNPNRIFVGQKLCIPPDP